MSCHGPRAVRDELVSYLTHPFYTLGLIYLLVLVFRAVLSWFPVGSSGIGPSTIGCTCSPSPW